MIERLSFTKDVPRGGEERKLSWQNMLKDFRDKISALEKSGLNPEKAEVNVLAEYAHNLAGDQSAENEAAFRMSVENSFSVLALKKAENKFLPADIPEPTDPEIDAVLGIANPTASDLVIYDIALNKKIVEVLSERFGDALAGLEKVSDVRPETLADATKILESLNLNELHLQTAKEKEARGPDFDMRETKKVLAKPLKPVLDFARTISTGPYASKFSSFIHEAEQIGRLIN
jgi:hypothetical protein